jgi:glycosyltransferase involved in cell wall biosynthesis
MKVAFLTTSLEPYYGWGRHSKEIVQRLPQLGIEPIVLVERGSPEIVVDGVQVHHVLHPYRDVLRNPLVSVRDALAARKLVAGCRFVHSLAEPQLVTAFLLSRLSRPLMVTAVGTYAISVLEGRWRALFRRAYRAARWIPAISAYTGARLAQQLPAVAPKITTIPLGVSEPPHEAPPQANEREPAFLAVGEVKLRKGTHLIIEALARLAPTFPHARLYIVGDARNTEYVGEVKRAIARHALEGNVVWLGKLSDPELDRLYRRVRGLVIPSLNHKHHFEGFGLVHLEANARGVPAIGSRGCGNEDAIRHGYSGYLIEQGNVDQLAEAMAALLGPETDWDRRSSNAVEFARSMGWDRTASAYATLYRGL